MTDLLPIKEAVYEMSLFFNQQPNDERITAYAKALSNYTPKQIIYAFKQVIGSGSAFFPSLAEILKHLRPDVEKKEDRAPIIVKEILAYIQAWHPDLERENIFRLSEDAQLAFLAIGNTANIRNSENYETMSAQVERLVKGVLAGKFNNIKNERLERIGINTGRRLEFQTADFSGYLPEGQ
jgi:hypothetical protein